MKTKTLILAALSAVVLAGCGGTIPGVPQEFRDFFPYQIGDTIVFTNGQREERLGVSYIHADNEWSFRGYGHVQTYLPIDMHVYTDSTSLFSFDVWMSSVDGNATIFDLEISICERQNHVWFSFNCRLQDPMNNTRHVLEQTKTYGEVAKNGINIQTLVLEKGKGITSFYDANHDEEWVLKEIKRY